MSPPQANTPGCTKQACGLRDANTATFEAADYAVYGLSYDSPKSQASWAAKHSLPFDFLCDTAGGGLIKALGCAKGDKSIKRSHFVVEKGGRILDAQVAVSPADSIARAVAFVSGLAKKDGAVPPAAKDAPKDAENGAAAAADASSVKAAAPATVGVAAADAAAVADAPAPAQ